MLFKWSWLRCLTKGGREKISIRCFPSDHQGSALLTNTLWMHLSKICWRDMAAIYVLLLGVENDGLSVRFSVLFPPNSHYVGSLKWCCWTQQTWKIQFRWVLVICYVLNEPTQSFRRVFTWKKFIVFFQVLTNYKKGGGSSAKTSLLLLLLSRFSRVWLCATP